MNAAEASPRASAGILLVALAAALFTAGSFVVPRFESAGLRGASALRVLYAPLCHQRPERSLELGGARQAICARCSGLYLGGVAGLVAGAIGVALGRLRPRPWWLALAALPTAVDAALPWVGLAGAANGPRLALALPLGGVAGLFLARGLEDLYAVRRSSRLPAPALEELGPHHPRSNPQ